MFLVCGLLVSLLFVGLVRAQSNAALLWTRLHADLLQTADIPTPMITRNMWLLDSTIYSVWTVYDSTAVATLSVPDKIPTAATTSTLETAIHYSAYTLLSDVYSAFPNELQLIRSRATSLQISLTPPPSDRSRPEYVGYSVGLAGIAYARTDGCNDRGQNQNSATSAPFSGRASLILRLHKLCSCEPTGFALGVGLCCF